MTDKEKLEKLKKLADAMYYAAQYLTTDASKLHKAMDEYHKFVTNEYHKEEPTIPDIVDEELEEASLRASIIRGQYIPKEYLDEYPYDAYAQSMFKRGAQWQKQQMMKEAVDGVVKVDAGGYPYIPQMELYDYEKDISLAKEGDKYKVVLIKGE